MTGLSDQFADGLISWSVDLSRFDAQLRAEVLGYLETLRTDLVRQIQEAELSGIGRMSQRVRRAETLVRQAGETIDQAYGRVNKHSMRQLSELAAVQGKQVIRLADEVFGSSVFTTAWTPGDLRALASQTLIQGRPAADWWGKQSADLQGRYASQIRMGALAGETNDQLVRRIRGTSTGKRVTTVVNGKRKVVHEFAGGVMQTSTREAKALVRTSVQSVSNSVLHETYKENADIVKAVLPLVTLDGRTTTTCMSLEGSKWDLEGKPLPDSTSQDPYPGPPPYHFACRTIESVETYSWDELAERASKSPELPKGPKPLEKHEIQAVKEFQAGLATPGTVTGGYAPIQNYLRTGSTKHFGVTRPEAVLKETARSLDTAILKSRDGAGKLLHRGIKHPVDEFGVKFNDLKVGHTYKSPGFTSTSTSEELVKKKFLNELNPGDKAVRIKIKTHDNSPSLDVGKITGDKTEKEILLPRNSSFKVTGISTRGKTPTVTVEIVQEAGEQAVTRGSLDKYYKMKPSARASMDGPVAGPQTYETWLKSKPVEFQKAQLGPGRYKLWSEGKITLSDLTDETLRPRRLEELRRIAEGKTAKPKPTPKKPAEKATVKKDAAEAKKAAKAATTKIESGEELLERLKKDLERLKDLPTGVSPQKTDLLAETKTAYRRFGDFRAEVYKRNPTVAGDLQKIIFMREGAQKEAAISKLWARIAKEDPTSYREYLRLQKEVTDLTAALRKPAPPPAAPAGKAAPSGPPEDLIKRGQLKAGEMSHWYQTTALTRTEAAARAIIHDALDLGANAIGNALKATASSTDLQGKLATARSWLSKIVAKRVNSGISIRAELNKTGRAFARPDLKKVSLSAQNTTSTHIHELGHVLETTSWHEKAAGFLRRRGAGEIPRPLSKITGNPAFRSNEFAVTDKFKDAYIGKIYADPYDITKLYATEITSMGLEMLWANPYKLIQQDPDFFVSLVNMLRGF